MPCCTTLGAHYIPFAHPRFPTVQFRGPVSGSLLFLSAPLCFLMVFSLSLWCQVSPGLRLCLSSLYQILFVGKPEQLLLAKAGVTNTAKCCLEWGRSEQQVRIPGKQEEWLFACASAWNAFRTCSRSRPSSRARFPRKRPRKRSLLPPLSLPLNSALPCHSVPCLVHLSPLKLVDFLRTESRSHSSVSRALARCQAHVDCLTKERGRVVRALPLIIAG